MSSTARLGLLSVSLFLLLLPLGLGKPGLPTHLKADEAAYYGMAMSLAHDGDLAFDQRDVDRFFTEFPYQPVNNLILMSADGWHHVSFAKPYVYSLFAAPLARLFGADGLFLFNTLLLAAMVWMGAVYLRRHNPEGIAALYAAGFFLLSVGFAYVYWLQPEVFNMAAVTACLFLGLPRDGEEEVPRPRRELLYAALSGAALALAVYNKPMLAVIGLAPLWPPLRERRWSRALAWLGGAAACLAALAIPSFLLTGTPTPYLGVARGGFTLCGPGQMPLLPTTTAAALPVAPVAPVATTPATPAATATPAVASTGNPVAAPTASAPAAPASAPAAPTPAPNAGGASGVTDSPTGNSYRWLFRLPDTSWSELRDNLGYFLWGRHTGLLLYMPFALLSLLLFLLHARRSPVRWLLLASVAAFAMFFLLLIAWNWQGGGGFVGNRYFVNVYPAFLFLVTRIRPKAVVPVGYAIAGLFLGPLLLAPFGSPVAEPTLQSHVRGVPFRWFPLELTLRNVPGYQRVSLGDFRLLGRRDVFLPLGEQMWLQGATPVELYLLADQPLGRLAFEVGSEAPHNRITLAMGDWSQQLELGADESRQVELPLQRPTRHWTIKTGDQYAYRLVVTASNGRPHVWERELPPDACPGWAWQSKQPDTFYVGTHLTYLGEAGGLAADVYRAQWHAVQLASPARAGEPFIVRATVRNASSNPWRNRGGARVRLAYHWLDDQGATVLRDGERTELAQPVPPGGELEVELRVLAPPRPGRYELVLDPVFETVAWFSERNPGATHRLAVDVLPASPTAAATPEPTPQSPNR